MGTLIPADAAMELRRRAGEPLGEPIDDLIGFARRLRVKVRSSRLNAAAGGQDALLVPSADGGFHAVLDPGLVRLPTAALGDELALGPDAWHEGRWRLAHELAHTLMYRPASPPIRRTPWSADEEAFCDSVADELLVPNELRWPLANADEMAERFGVPTSAIERLHHLVAHAA